MTPINTRYPLFNTALRQHVQANLAQFERRSQPTQQLKQAAVAVTLVKLAHDPAIYDIPFRSGWEQQAALVLTTRASKLRQHAGQWALPGGRIDAGETAAAAALRELDEEVGLRLDRSHILGWLDDFTTRSGYVIRPVVVWGGDNVVLRPNPAEVASAHRLPLAEFLREDAPILEPAAAGKAPVLLMPLGSSWIAAPTGAILYQFREVAILGKSTRVAHFEQPRFAWH